jgi:hypothetical protein
LLLGHARVEDHLEQQSPSSSLRSAMSPRSQASATS